ncbi:MAG: extracellular solute-binding protein [Candidatus Gastranaerophilales bacterium]|nr:extracellular solute-binding protein [Candidatus Gastranaerophilales bacterium]
MNLKKRICAVAIVAIMAAATVYGSTLRLADRDEIATDSWFQHKDTIYFWYSDNALTDYINGAAVTFGEREDVRVIPVLTSASEYLEAINQASLEGVQMPDAYLISNDSLEKAYLAGLASEVQDEGSVCSEANFPRAALSAVSYHGKIVAYPLFYETSALIYNETYLDMWALQQAEREQAEADSEGLGLQGPQNEDGTLDESAAGFNEELLAERTQAYRDSALPVTVDDILNIADTFDVPEGVGIMEWDVSDIFYNYWFVGNYMIVGGDAGDDSGVLQINNEEAIQCLEVYKALNQFFSMESDTITYENTVQDFIEGKVVFTIATTDVVKSIEEAKAEGRFAYEYGVTTMPDVSDELSSRSLSVTNAVVVNGYSEHMELANRFAAFLSDEYAKGLYERSGKAPANLNAYANEDALSIFALEYADSVPLPKMLETGNYWMHLEVLFSKVWNGADVNEMVQELADQIELQVHAIEM